MQIIRVRHDVAFIADIPIQMKGVQLEVPSDSLMVFGAPYLKFEKGEVRAGSHTSDDSVAETHRYRTCYTAIFYTINDRGHFYVLFFQRLRAARETGDQMNNLLFSFSPW